MNKFMESMLSNDALTANGALTNSTSLNGCLDLFFLAGACRRESEQNIINKLVCSYDENRVKTLKIIFWAGDIRQGAGERRFFKLAMDWLYKNHIEDFYMYVDNVPEFSRWDILFDKAVNDDKILSFICEHIKTDRLLCKWLPRKIQVKDKTKSQENMTDKFGNKIKVTTEKESCVRELYGGLAKAIRKKMNLSPKAYRKLLVNNTDVVEQKMCKKQWGEIDYSKIPSVAINKYNKAWYRNDKERFEKYIEEVKAGKSKINAAAIFPHDIIKSAIGTLGYSYTVGTLNDAKIAQWEALPNYLEEGGTNTILPVCDVSGSMAGMPILISLALGLYISERNVGPFKDAFITFSQRPKMEYLKGNVSERLQQLSSAHWDSSTNFEGIFKLILNKAIEHQLRQDELPKAILVISDMEFNEAQGYGNRVTNFNSVKSMFESAGYKLPALVFWNVNGRVHNVPINMHDENTALVSGASPSIIKSVLSGQISPIAIMDKTIETERYSFIR